MPGLSSLSNLTSENSPFDLLVFYNQFSRHFEFLINPATGYPEIQINLDATGIQITDCQGNPIHLDLGLRTPTSLASSKALTPGALFRFPFT